MLAARCGWRRHAHLPADRLPGRVLHLPAEPKGRLLLFLVLLPFWILLVRTVAWAVLLVTRRHLNNLFLSRPHRSADKG